MYAHQQFITNKEAAAIATASLFIIRVVLQSCQCLQPFPSGYFCLLSMV